MSAVMNTSAVTWRALQLADLERVLVVEAQAYPFPWTQGNFIDAIAAGYDAECLDDAQNGLIGYHVSMVGVDEMHLLNLTVTPTLQRRGFGQLLLERVIARAKALGLQTLWLEVRASNLAALALYRGRGFTDVATRPAYYPGAAGQREAAQVMRLPLAMP